MRDLWARHVGHGTPSGRALPLTAIMVLVCDGRLLRPALAEFPTAGDIQLVKVAFDSEVGVGW